MSEHERRRHPRFPLRLRIQLQRGGEPLEAEIVNASISGCMLLVAIPLEPGEVLEASIPLLNVLNGKLHVLRCESGPSGYMVAARFEEPGSTEPGSSDPRVVN